MSADTPLLPATVAAIRQEVLRSRARYPGRAHMFVALIESAGTLAKRLLCAPVAAEAMANVDLPDDARKLFARQRGDGIAAEARKVAAIAARIMEEGDADFDQPGLRSPIPSPEEMALAICGEGGGFSVGCLRNGAAAGIRAERARVSAEMAALRRTLERWVHGQQIEGDYVCPDSLRMTEAERKLEEARAALAPLAAQYAGCSLGDTLANALAALSRVTP